MEYSQESGRVGAVSHSPDQPTDWRNRVSLTRGRSQESEQEGQGNRVVLTSSSYARFHVLFKCKIRQ